MNGPAKPSLLWLRTTRRRRLPFWEVNVRLAAGLFGLAPLRRSRDFLFQLNDLGVRSLPLTVVVVALLGFTGAFLAEGRFEYLYRAQLPTILGRLFVEQIVPLTTTFLVIGRSIVSMTAELASMRLAREIDSLEIIGEDAVEFLLLPRVLALAVALPMLTFFAFFAAMAGGWAAEARVPGALDFGRWASEFFGIGSPRVLGVAIAVRPGMLLVAVFKTMAQAWAVVAIGGYCGLSARPDQEEPIGRAVRRSVAWCIVAVTVINLLFAVIFPS